MATVVGGPTTADAALFKDVSAAWERGEPEKLLPKLERALPRSLDYRLWHIHGLILRRLERHGDALKSLERSVELAPDAANPAHALARARLEAGLPSVEAFARAVQLDRGKPEVLIGLSAALTAERRIDDAIAGLERSLSFSPQWTDGHAQLAKLRWMAGERQGFARSFEEALARGHGTFELWRQYLTVLMHAEHWDDALRAITNGRAAIGPNPLFSASEAAIHSELGEIARADELFEAMEEDHWWLQLRLVRHHLRASRPDEASRAIDPWLETPEAYLFWPYASSAWRMTGDPRSDWLEGDERFVGIYDIAERLPPLDQLAETLRRLHTVKGEPLEQSLRGGTQTDGNLFQFIDPVLVRLREAIRATVAEHAAQLPPHDERHPLLAPRRDVIKFTGAWSVRLNSGGFHANHVHPFGWISSALYIVLPSDLGEDEAGFLALGEPQAQLKLDLPPTKLIEPKPGRLALFPSWMWHGTRPFGAGERMTVAFDVARA